MKPKKFIIKCIEKINEMKLKISLIKNLTENKLNLTERMADSGLMLLIKLLLSYGIIGGPH